MQRRTTDFVYIDDISVLNRARAIKEDDVAKLADSLRAAGLRTPISIRVVLDKDGYGEPILVTGATRLEAARRLGWEKIECFVVEDEDEDEARRWEIAENLHRCELTAQEHAEHVAEWDKLTTKKRNDAKLSGQIVPKLIGRPRTSTDTAETLGLTKKDINRANAISSMSQDAKEAALDTKNKLHDNQAALLEAAKAPPEQQAAVIRAIDAAGTVTAYRSKIDGDIRQRAAREVAAPTSAPNALERLIAAWNLAGPEAQDEFLSRADLASRFESLRKSSRMTVSASTETVSGHDGQGRCQIEMLPQHLIGRRDYAALDQKRVQALADSIREIGLMSPIIVTPDKIFWNGSNVDGWDILAGRHRYTALTSILSWEDIPCIVCKANDLQAELITIDENLIRRDLSVAERAEQTTRRKEIYEILHPETANGATGGGRNQLRQNGEAAARFTRATSEATGRSERAVQRDAERGAVKLLF